VCSAPHSARTSLCGAMEPLAQGDGAAAARRARLRKSDPTPSNSLATASSPLRKTPAPSPGAHPRFSSGWEYPLTREEKKQRVMCLYESELKTAQKQSERSIEALVGENEALHARLEEREEPDTYYIGDNEEQRGQSGRGAWRVIASTALLAVALALVVVAASTLRKAAPLPVTTPAPAGAANATAAGAEKRRLGLTLANASAAALQLNASNATATAPVLPPNTTATVKRMREHGLAKLGVSDCWKAEWYFASALELLEGLNSSTVAGNERLNLLGDRGFALVCSQRFKEAADLLEQRLSHSPEGQKPSHLLNALGYAKFRMKDYKDASRIFELGAKADPMNPILWNNLAAAKMVSGDLRAADDALYYAVDRADPNKHSQQFNVEDYHRLIFMANAENLWTRSQRQSSGLPQIELWRPDAK